MEINYYCFNIDCSRSIFNIDNCFITKAKIDEALTVSLKCQFCKHTLVAKPMLRLDRQLKEMLQKKKTYKTIIIDDDLNFQVTASQLFKDSRCLSQPIHLNDAPAAITYLTTHQKDIDKMPDFIFADIKMSKMMIWDFLNVYESLAPKMSKKITIYLITDEVILLDDDRMKIYPDIKGLIGKSFNVEFLDSIC